MNKKRPIPFSLHFSSTSHGRGGHFFWILTMDEYSDSNSGDELGLMALAVALAAAAKKKRKHLVWMKEIFLDRKNEGSRKLVNAMRISNRDLYT